MVDIGAIGGGPSIVDMAKQAIEQQQKQSNDVASFDQVLMEKQGETAPDQDLMANRDLTVDQGVQQLDLDRPVEQVQTKAEMDLHKVTEADATKEDNPLKGILNELSEGHNKLNRLIKLAESDVELSPQQLIAVQSGVHKITEELEMANKVIEQAVGSVKTMMQQQV